MRLGAVGNLVAGAGSEVKLPAISQPRVQLAFEAQQDMALAAPVIGAIAGRVFDHSHPNVSELLGAPIGGPRFTAVFRRLDL